MTRNTYGNSIPFVEMQRKVEEKRKQKKKPANDPKVVTFGNDRGGMGEEKSTLLDRRYFCACVGESA